jgi:hypothetical protein
MTGKQNMYPCPCCKYLTLSEKPPGTFEICEVCGWEDDNVQFEDPNYAGGANSVSLNQARKNYALFGACDESAKSFTRSPKPEEKC